MEVQRPTVCHHLNCIFFCCYGNMLPFLPFYEMDLLHLKASSLLDENAGMNYVWFSTCPLLLCNINWIIDSGNED